MPASRIDDITVETFEADAMAAFAIERISLKARGIDLPDTLKTRSAWKLGFGAGAAWAVRQLKTTEEP